MAGAPGVENERTQHRELEALERILRLGELDDRKRKTFEESTSPNFNTLGCYGQCPRCRLLSPPIWSTKKIAHEWLSGAVTRNRTAFGRFGSRRLDQSTSPLIRCNSAR